jgi:ligand-binding sensor domain-containing protein/two-component sensor histidine kinase
MRAYLRFHGYVTGILVWFGAGLLTAQNHGLPMRVHAENISFSEGFNLNFITDFCTDKRGMVWISGLQGLVRFSGVTQKRYYEADSVNQTGLGPGGYTSLELDANHIIWTGGPSGVYWYNEVSDSFCCIQGPGLSKWTPEKRVIAISRDKKTLWMQEEDGLWKKSLPNGNWEALKFPPSKDVVFLKCLSTGHLLMRENLNTVVYDPVNQAIVGTYFGALSTFEDSNGDIYLGTWRSGLRRISITSKEQTIYYPGTDYLPGVYGEVFNGFGLAPDITGDSILWCNTLENGIWFFNLRQQKFVHNLNWSENRSTGLPGYAAGPMHVDNGGVVWIEMSGVTRITPHRQQLIDQNIYGLDADDSRAVWLRNEISDRYRKGFKWMAISYYGLVSYDETRQKAEKWWFYKSGQPILKRERNYFAEIAYDRVGNLWANTETGFMIVNKQGRVRTIDVDKYNNNNGAVNDFIFDDENTCWMGTDLGLCALNPKTGGVVSFNNTIHAREPAILDLEIDKKGIWLATDLGIHFFDFSTKKFTGFPHQHQGSQQAEYNSYKCLLRLRSGKILATNQHGLAMIEDNSVRQIANLGNMNFTHIRSMVEDENGKIWIKTLGQVIKFDLQQGVAVSRFESDGGFFASTTGTYFTLLGGGGNSRLIFNPLTLREFKYTTAPVFTAFKIYDKPYHIHYDSASSAPVHLNWRQNALTFEYDCPDFTSHVQTSYDVMLKGYDKTWKPQGRKRNITYTNLAPGHYSFHLRVTNMEGQKHPQEAVINIVIKPPFWQTWWFRALVCSILAGIVYGVFRFRVYNIRREEQRKTEFYRLKAETEMRALRAQMNPHFIFNCMNTIEAFIIEKKEDEATGFLQKFSKLIRAVLENAQHDNISLSLELEVLEWYIQLEQIRANNRWQYQINISPDLDPSTRNILPLILQPFVENAIVHGLHHRRTKGGELTITLQKTAKNHLQAVITDNGVGRTMAASRHKHFNGKKSSLGVQFTTDRVVKLNPPGRHDFSVHVVDLYPDQETMTGTEVVVTLP